MFTLDTNIIIGYLNGDEKITSQLINWRDRKISLFISVITKIEVLSYPKLKQEEIVKIKRFIQEFTAVPVDHQVGEIAAAIRRKIKTSIGDSLIIATAVLTHSSLATRDKELIRKAKTFTAIKSI